MDSIVFTIPTPKQVKQTTRDDRIRIQALSQAGLTVDQIVLQLNLTLRQVKYAL